MDEDQRKAIFQAVVEAQDAGMPVVDARKTVAKQFGVSEAEVRRIEEEGVKDEWPPL